jgi:hypothetical protein
MIQPTFIVQRTPREWDTEDWIPDEDQPKDTMVGPDKALEWLLHELGKYPYYAEKHKFRIVSRNEKVWHSPDVIEGMLK